MFHYFAEVHLLCFYFFSLRPQQDQKKKWPTSYPVSLKKHASAKNVEKFKIIYLCIQFAAEMNTRGRETPFAFIHFHNNCDYLTGYQLL